MGERVEGCRHLPAGPALAACILMWPLPSAADDQRAMETLTRALPSVAVALIYRIVDCDHWGGEEPYDDDRKARIEKAMNGLRCNDVEHDEAMARKRYAAFRDVLDALDKAKALAR